MFSVMVEVGVDLFVFLEGACFNTFGIVRIFEGPYDSVEVEDVPLVCSQFEDNAIIWVFGRYGPHLTGLFGGAYGVLEGAIGVGDVCLQFCPYVGLVCQPCVYFCSEGV